ncbi:MAG: FxsA family protein [Planctomycetia bacterium]|nr:FxsA family protein [Planctomycetia bacterium]
MIISLALLSLILTVLEIALFVLLGSSIGWFETILLALATSFIGLSLVRLRLQQLWNSNRSSSLNYSDNSNQSENIILHGFMLHFAKILFWTPGFLSNLFGFVLLFAPGRSLVFALFRKWLKMFASSNQFSGPFNRSSNNFQRFYHFEFHQPFSQDNGHKNDYNNYSDSNSNFFKNSKQKQNSSIEETFTDNKNVENKGQGDLDNQGDDIIDVEFEIKPK